jgi:transcriptional regulator with XRE-family HTH domain
MKARTASEVIREHVQTIRWDGKGWSQATLGRRLTKQLGFEQLDRSTVAKIEVGQRRILADEVLGLAAALDVAPVHLMVPIEKAQMRVVPASKRTHSAGEVRAWICGQRPLGGIALDKDFYRDWRPAEEVARRETPGMANMVGHLNEVAEAYAASDRERFDQALAGVEKGLAFFQDLAGELPDREA